MKKILFLAAASLLFTATYAIEEWITPPEKTCTENRGVSSKGICKASFPHSNRICREVGGRLPTINELQNVARECGAKDPKSKNVLGLSYQSCYKEKGFTSNSSYWSSTRGTYSPNNVLLFNFQTGIIIQDSISMFNRYKVRCVRQNLTY